MLPATAAAVVDGGARLRVCTSTQKVQGTPGVATPGLDGQELSQRLMQSTASVDLGRVILCACADVCQRAKGFKTRLVSLHPGLTVKSSARG
jgi:hypothetical protein